MKAIVNDACIGCGLCTGTCPEVFSMREDGQAQGSEFDAASYIEEIVYKNEELSSRYADISGQVDTDTPGIYNVTYSYTYSKDDVTGSVILTVVVE